MSFPTSMPLVDLDAQQDEIADKVEIGMKDDFTQGFFIGGQAVTEFEHAYPGFLGARVDVANCTGTPELTLIEPERVAEAVGPRPHAIVHVHAFGRTAPVERLQTTAARCVMAIVEDTAQSQGATLPGRFAGTVGQAADASSYRRENLGGAADAGTATTSDGSVAARVRLLGALGDLVRHQHKATRMNSRFASPQEQAAGSGTDIQYPVRLHLCKACQELSCDFPVTEKPAATVLSRPIVPHITVDQQVYVAEPPSKSVGRSRQCPKS
jgi:dTDP-4-amino-4,6-dideoxygalactose transaminase